MALLTAAQALLSGTTLTQTAASASDTFPCSGQTFLLAETTGTPSSLTFVAQGSYQGVAIGNLVIAMAATALKIIGPIPAEVFANSSGIVTVTSSSQVGLTYSVIRV